MCNNTKKNFVLPSEIWKGLFPFSCVHLFFWYFQLIAFLQSPSVFRIIFVCHIHLFLCHIAYKIVKVLVTHFWPNNSYWTGFKGLLRQFLSHCLNVSLNSFLCQLYFNFYLVQSRRISFFDMVIVAAYCLIGIHIFIRLHY